MVNRPPQAQPGQKEQEHPAGDNSSYDGHRVHVSGGLAGSGDSNQDEGYNLCGMDTS